MAEVLPGSSKRRYTVTTTERRLYPELADEIGKPFTCDGCVDKDAICREVSWQRVLQGFRVERVYSTHV